MAAIRGISPSFLAFFPYFLTGLLPFWAGMLLAAVSGFPWRPGVLIFGTAGAAALILAALASREAFAPGAGRCPGWTGLTPGQARRTSLACLAAAALSGVVLQFGFRTGALTITLGLVGVLGGYFSFAPPFKLHRRAWGEAAGALCFGLLPVAAGFYLQGGHLVTEILIYGLTLTFAGFNMFLAHGFPSPEKREGTAPHSLAERLRPVTAAFIFTIFNILTILGLVVCLLFPASPLPLRNLIWLLLALAVVNQELAKRRAYLSETRLRLWCRLTLALHLGLGAVFNVMLWQRL